jgi:MFS transporter, NNP family, nitrate/nitrite transporter
MSSLKVLHRPEVSLVIAAMGYGLNYWAWLLVGPLGPRLGNQYGLNWHQWALLGVAAIAVGSLVRIPAGVLADRHGARLVMPAVSIAAAVAVLALATVDSLAALIAVTCVTGIAGGAFSAGAAAVTRAFSPGQRGFALSVFGAGMGLALAAAIASRPVLTINQHSGLLLLATALLGHAALAATLLRDGPQPALRGTSGRQMALAALKLPATKHLAAWYAVSFGGVAAFALYLPYYLHRAYGVSSPEATLYAAACVAVVGAGRPVGGFLADRYPPERVLSSCFAAAGGLLVVVAFHPPLTPAALPALLGVAVSLGAGAGVVLALIGRTAPAERAGTITGVIGAIGSGVGLLPPLVLTAASDLHGDDAIGLTLLAGAAFAAAALLHLRRSWIGAAATFPAPAIPDDGAVTTVIALSAPQIRLRLGEVTATLAALAVKQELVIIYADPETPPGGCAGYPLVAGLRHHLPHHTILAMTTAAPPHPHEVAAIADMLDIGAVTVALVTSANPDPSALLLASQIGADQVLHLASDRVEGLVLNPTGPTSGVPRPRSKLNPSRL